MPAATAIALFYFLYIGALGFWFPYFTTYLTSLGVPAAEATRILALLPVSALIAPPIVGLLADWMRVRSRLLRLAASGAFLTFLGFFLVPGTRPGEHALAPTARLCIYATMIAFSLTRAPILSLADATAYECVRHHGGSYGHLRLWGSLGFFLAALASGALTARYGMSQILVTTALSLGLAALSTWLIVPAANAASAGPTRAERTGAITSERRGALTLVERLHAGQLWLPLGAAALGQLAGAAYDAAFSIHLVRLGYSTRFVGIAWGVAVLTETLLLGASGAVIARLGAARLVALSLAVASGRWLLLGQVTSPAAILLLQPLHGITFGWFYAGSTALLSERSSPAAATTGQGLLAGAMGLGSLVGMSMAGALLERLGGRGLFSLAAAAAALGTLLAALAVRAARSPQRLEEEREQVTAAAR